MFENSEAFWDGIEHSALATAVRESIWIYPFLETVHAVGLGLIFGSILAFDLRVLGIHKSLPLRLLGRHLLPWVWAGFVLNATSGVLMFASDAVEFSTNPALRAKLVLIALAGINAYVFQKRIYQRQMTEEYDVDFPSPPAARVSAALSIVLWLAIITAGRMMAFVK